MKILDNIKSHLAALVSVVGAIFLFLSDAVRPATLPINFPESISNFEGVTKFIIGAVLLILLYPLVKYSSTKYKNRWWIGAIIAILLSIATFSCYFTIGGRYVIQDEFSKSNYIVGRAYTPYTQLAVDSLKKKDKHILINSRYLLATFGQPNDIWLEEGIVQNARNYFLSYACTIMCVVVFLIMSLQASFTLDKSSLNEKE